MTTVREVINDAMVEIGAQDPNEAVTAEAAAYGLRVLNRMLGKWNTEELMVYTVNRDLYSLTAGKQVYTLGTGGDFNVARPVKIQAVSVILNTGAYPVEIPVDVLNDEEWQNTSVKTTPSNFPTKVWITGNMPLNSLYFWPVPQDSTVQVALYTWGRTSAFADVNQSIVFPDGYEEAIVTNLGMALSGSYSIQPSATLQMRAAAARAAIQSMNISPVWLTSDDGLVGRGNNNAIRSFGYQVD